MEKYQCDICGKKHEIFKGLKSPPPAILDEITDDDKDARIKNEGNIFIVDNDTLLVSGIINIKIEDPDESIFRWEVWIEVSKQSLIQHSEGFKKKTAIELDAILLSELPFYQKSKGLKSKAILRPRDDEDIVIRIEENSVLKDDQLKPITKDRVIELMQMLYHHPEREERHSSDKSFSTRLLEEIDNVDTKTDFVISLATDIVLFQIISNKMLETNQAIERGYGLHLSFDDSDEERVKELVRFKDMEYSKEFDCYDIDEIPTFQTDLGTDKKRLEELVRKIVVDVYREELETIEIDSFEN